MKTAVEIMRAVKELGGRIQPVGDRLRTLLPENCSPELKNDIRQHKAEILDLLKAKSENLPVHCIPWLHVARQILAGEFDDADRSLADSLTIGLENIQNPDCQHALARLATLKPTKKRKKGL